MITGYAHITFKRKSDFSGMIILDGIVKILCYHFGRGKILESVNSPYYNTSRFIVWRSDVCKAVRNLDQAFGIELSTEEVTLRYEVDRFWSVYRHVINEIGRLLEVGPGGEGWVYVGIDADPKVKRSV